MEVYNYGFRQQSYFNIIHRISASNCKKGHRGRDRMVVIFTTTCAISDHHHCCCEFEWGS